jgi:citrate lyase beta subunit
LINYVSPAGRNIHPVDFGAFLYTPATHRNLADVVRGRTMVDVSAICICLEDAILDTEVETAWTRLKDTLSGLDQLDPGKRPLLFVRPRGLEMAARFAQEDCHRYVDGIVAPKMTIDKAAEWGRALDGTDLLVMPTLETVGVFDPGWVGTMGDAIISELNERVPMVRIGGNDLMSCLRLRREAGHTLYEGPLSYVVSMLVSILVPKGLRLAAPVFEHADRIDTLAREIERDVAFGLCGKTAIHPGQIPIIQNALKVDLRDYEAAKLILAKDAPAVFKNNGAMCEPATHRRWAEDTLARHARWGTRQVLPYQVTG